jgi:hypothetical protein
VQTHSIAKTVATRISAIGGIGLLTVAMLAGTAGTAGAASVTPTPVNEANPTCADFDAGLTELKAEEKLGDGTFTDGTLEVMIANFENSDSRTPGSFDWRSNIGVDAVFVKAGNDKHNLFVYDPESTGDTDLGPQAGEGNGISHISFCYDDDDEPIPPTDEPPADEPTPPADEPTPPADEPGTSDEPSPTPDGGVQGTVGTPASTLPPTDTVSADTSSASVIPALLVLISITSVTGIMIIRMPSRSRR